MFTFRTFTEEEIEKLREQVASSLLKDKDRVQKIIDRLKSNETEEETVVEDFT